MELLALVVGGAAGAAASRGFSRLREHRTSPDGLADLLSKILVTWCIK